MEELIRQSTQQYVKYQREDMLKHPVLCEQIIANQYHGDMLKIRQYYRVFQNSSSYARGRDVIIDRVKEKVSYHLVIVVQVVLQDLLVITSVVEHLQPQIRIFSLLHRLLHFRHSRQIIGRVFLQAQEPFSSLVPREK